MTSQHARRPVSVISFFSCTIYRTRIAYVTQLYHSQYLYDFYMQASPNMNSLRYSRQSFTMPKVFFDVGAVADHDYLFIIPRWTPWTVCGFWRTGRRPTVIANDAS